MRNKEELKKGVAEMLHMLRIKKGLSKNGMAEFLGINKRTWYAWESGESAPNIVDFIAIFDECAEPMLNPILQLLYPDEFAGKNSESDIETVRMATGKFFHEIATDHMVRIWNFIINGAHGSNIAPQAEEFCALNHLPMEYRYYIAELVYVFYKTSAMRGQLVATDDVMPNISIWEQGLKKSQKAAFYKLQSYTTITEESE